MKSLKIRSVFLRWFFSYLIMMGLVMLLSVGLYFYSYRIINDQAEEVNQTLLAKAQVEIDNYFSEARSNITSLLLDSSVQKAAKVNGTFSVGDREMLHDIHVSITNKCVIFPGLSHMFIYFTGGDTVISEKGHMDSRLFYDLYYRQEGWGKDDFVNLLKKEWTGNIETVINSRGGRELLFLQNSFPRGVTKSAATFAVSIADTEINRWLEELKWSRDVELLMVSADGIVIGRQELRDAVLTELPRPEELLWEKQADIGGVSYQLTVMDSKETDFSFVALAPVGSIRESAGRIQLFTIVGLGICITLGVILAYILTGINYHPLRHIMDMFGNYGKDGAAELRNEYQWLNDQTVRFLDEHREIKRKFFDNEKILKNQYLYRLVTLPYDGKNRYTELFSQDGGLKYPCNLVLLLFLSYEDDSQWQAEMERGLLRFILANVMEELLEGGYGMEMVELRDSVACVINAKESGPDAREHLESILDQFQRFIWEQMKIRVTVSCGSFQNGPEGIYQSYSMAREASDYREHTEEHPVIWYEDIQNRNTLYDYSMETEQRIVNAIRAGEADDACGWVREVIEKNYCQKGILPSMKKCLLYELLGTVMKGAEQGGGVEFMNAAIGERDITSHMEAGDAEKYFRTVISGLCAEIRRKEQIKREDKQFGRQVMDYVMENFQDPDLNVSLTAMHFNITPTYLSQLFKEQTGLSLLEFINHTRVEKVRELLETGMSVVEICGQTGFRSSGALIRVFKKETGITPGQMKRIVK